VLVVFSLASPSSGTFHRSPQTGLGLYIKSGF
jgi:hypothetical protein